MMIRRVAVALALLLCVAAPARAACPVVASSWINASAASASTNHVFTMPSGLASGDTLLCGVVGDDTITAFAPGGSGLTELYDGETATTNHIAGYYKTATGGEGASLTVTSTGTNTSAAFCLRITGAQSPPEAGSIAGTSDAFPDPSALDPSWSNEDTLYIAIAGLSNPRTMDAYPSGYTTNQASFAGTNEGIAYATKCVVGGGASENPGTFTQQNTSAGGWNAITVAIRAAAAATCVAQLMLFGVGGCP